MYCRPQRRSQLLIFSFAAFSLAADRRAITNDFSGYPSGAQSCLYNAADESGCNGDTVPKMNLCLCGNDGGFVSNSAKCVAENDPDDMAGTYEVMRVHCSDSSTPLTISESEWMAVESSLSSSTSSTRIASKTTSKTTSRTTSRTTSPITSETASETAIETASQTSSGKAPTTTIATTVTASSSPAPTSGAVNGGVLSTATKGGIIGGSVAAGLGLLAAGLFFLCRYRRRRDPAYKQVHLVGGQLQSNHGSEGSTTFGIAGSQTALSSHKSTSPWNLSRGSGLRKSWYSSPDGSQIPWSPSAFDVVALHHHYGNLHQPTPDIYEMSTDSERLAAATPSTAPIEMPVISVTSPTVSPASRYYGADWSSEIHQEPSRYEPYRPSC